MTPGLAALTDPSFKGLTVVVVVTVRDRILLLSRLSSAGAGLLTATVAVVVVSSLIPATTAVALTMLIGRVQAGSADDLIVTTAAPLMVLAVVLLVGYALGVVQDPLFFLVRSRVDGAHREAVARLVASVPTVEVLERSEVRRLVRQASAEPGNWTDRTPGAGALAQLSTLARGGVLVSTGAVLARYSWWLVPLLITATLGFQRLNQRDDLTLYRTYRQGVGHELGARLWQDTIVSPAEGKEMRVFGLGGWIVGRFDHHVRAQFGPLGDLQTRLATQQWRQLLLVAVPLTIAFPVVAVSAASGRAGVAVATAVFAAGQAVYQSLGGDHRDVIGATACLRASEQLRQELGAQTPDDSAAGEPSGRPSDGESSPPMVCFENVHFAYPDTGRQVLRGLDLQIRPGELLGIVGLNGAGKSTLIKLLAGLYRPTSGRITAGGVDITDIGLQAWRQQLAIVFQDFARYHLSAADNIALGYPRLPADDDAIDGAARDAGFGGVLAGLPDGRHTPLTRSRAGGVDLSGGQWQQVALARALYAVRAGARLLVLDEPTAHLDVRTESETFQRLAAHKQGASVVLISHRLSTVRQADRIVFLQDGRITESGTHDELMARGGGYAAMFTIQAERFRRGFDDRIEEGELV